MNTLCLGNRLARLARVALATVATGVAAAGLGGCNAGGNNLLEANRALNERVQALTDQNAALQNLNQQLQDALQARDRSLAELEALVNELRSGNDDVMARYRDLEGRLGGLRFGELDPETDQALRELAAQHSDLLEYDPQRGVLRFKSDLTFASGSDAVSDNARNTLRQLGQILNTGAAAGYDIRVLGHTDSQRIGNPATRQRHPTNMHLSAHRAISVYEVMREIGVNPQRFEVAGRGEFDPLVANAANGNTPQNRRVEIYLTRPTGRRTPVIAPGDAPSAAPASPAPTRRESAEDLMK